MGIFSKLKKRGNMDDEFNIERAKVVHDHDVIAAFVAAGLGDCYLVKDDSGKVMGIFRDSPELEDIFQQLKDSSLTVNICEYWDSEQQLDMAQNDQWPHEIANRQ